MCYRTQMRTSCLTKRALLQLLGSTQAYEPPMQANEQLTWINELPTQASEPTTQTNEPPTHANEPFDDAGDQSNRTTIPPYGTDL